MGKILSSISFVLTNIFIILIGVILNYLVPLGLSIEEYSDYRIFLLILPYFSLLHLGIIDGIYLKLRKENIQSKAKEISQGFKALIIVRLITSTICICIISFIVENLEFRYILFAAIINTFILNLSSYFNYVFQTTGNFKSSNFILLIPKLLFFIFFLIFYWIEKITLENLIIFNILSSLIVLILLLLKSWKIIFENTKELYNTTINLIKFGFYLMLSNVVISLILTLDKLLVKNFLNKIEYSNYLFAGAILVIIYQLAGSVGSIIFSYINKEELMNIKKYQKIELIIIGLIAFSINIFFLNEIIIINFLEDYVLSINYLNALLPTIYFLVLIQILQSAYFKIFKLNKIYMKITFIIIFLEVSLIMIALLLTHSAVIAIYVFNLILFVWYLLNLIVIRKKLSINTFIPKNIFILFIFIEIYYTLDILSEETLLNVILYNIFILLIFLIYFKKNIIITVSGKNNS